jgi:phosphatidylglycerophosphatase C
LTEGQATPDKAGPGGRPEQTAGQSVAVFDFDGTLTRRDSLLPFLVFVRGAVATARAVIAESPRFGLVLLGRASRDDAKEALLTRLLSGADARELNGYAQEFAERLVRAGLRPSMRRRLEWHRRAGHRIVIASASPTLYLNIAGGRLGVDGVLATELEVDDDGRLTGKLSGDNCRGPEKVVRLRTWLEGSLAEQPAQLWAYGDSVGDAELLAEADVAVWVGWRRRLPRHPARRGPRLK